jgi:hypothetical protein
VVSERRFLERIGKSASDNDQKTYSADQLAALSKMWIDMIREFSQPGLLDERDRCFGFRELATISVSLYAACNGSQKIDNLNSPRNWLKKRKLVHQGS